MQKDNSTFLYKRELRTRALSKTKEPVILETHGGQGKLFKSCYAQVPFGVVCEKKIPAANILAAQRPTWAVYCGDTLKMLAGGLGKVWPFNFIDLDPYGSPFDCLEAIFAAGLAEPVVRFVVNDGLRQKVNVGGAWDCAALSEIVDDFGNSINKQYLAAAKEKIRRVAGRGGYDVNEWFGYYCGHADQMTHYTFVAERRAT